MCVDTIILLGVVHSIAEVWFSGRQTGHIGIGTEPRHRHVYQSGKLFHQRQVFGGPVSAFVRSTLILPKWDPSAPCSLPFSLSGGICSSPSSRLDYSID